MESSSRQSLAIKWGIFCITSSITPFVAYTPLYLKQLGFSASQIGFGNLMGMPLLFVLPLVGLLVDRFRARKLTLLIALLVSIITYLALLLPLVAPFGIKCHEISNTSLTNDTQNYGKESLYFGNVTKAFSKTVNNSDLTVWQYYQSVRLPAHLATFEAVNQNETGSKRLKTNTYLPWTSSLFIYIVVIRGIYEFLRRLIIALYNLIIMTHVKNERADYGSYLCFGYFGSSFIFVAVGITIKFTQQTFCGNVSYGYYVTFIWVGLTTCMSLPILPWIEFEYLDHRVVSWSDVRSVILECHYLIVLVVTMALGSCGAFLQYWEFWYIAELSGSPVVMTTTSLLHEPFLAILFLSSKLIINRIGDLQSLALGLLLGVISLLGLSCIQNPWLVMVLDIPLSAAFAISRTAFNVHFSKAGSKASSVVIYALADGAYSLGREGGSACLGALFSAIGSHATLRYHAVTLAVVFVLFVAYILLGGEHLDQYEKLPNIDSEDER